MVFSWSDWFFFQVEGPATLKNKDGKTAVDLLSPKDPMRKIIKPGQWKAW